MSKNRVNLINGDCLEKMKYINNKINMVLVDLPYGQTGCDWDTVIDLKKMWQELKKICYKNCTYVFFCTSKFGYKLIQSNESWFRYDLVWEKSNVVGFLNVNKMPMRKHEMIYIFKNPYNFDYDINKNLNLRQYFKNVFNYIDKTKIDLIKQLGQCIDHPLRFNSSQFSLPTENTYNNLIKFYKIDNMKGFETYQDLKEEWKNPKNENKKNYIYNPQKTKGKSYKNIRCRPGLECRGSDIYTKPKITNTINITGERFPNSILKFSNPMDGHHPTQKPINLCEWLIKSYSNEKDYILDFTMGSGTSGIACLNTNRHFIGIEKDEQIFKTAKNRIILSELRNIKLKPIIKNNV
jgi:site-specific DNA-methyltransferase (adenine-specific)